MCRRQSNPPPAQPSRVIVAEKQLDVDRAAKWLYAAIDTEPKLLMELNLFSCHGTDPMVAFLHRLTQTYDISAAEFLAEGIGYLTALARLSWAFSATIPP